MTKQNSSPDVESACQRIIIIIIIIIISINEQINVAYSPKTSRTRNKQTKQENSDVFGRWKHRQLSKSQRH